jgi:hypothetical protein
LTSSCARSAMSSNPAGGATQMYSLNFRRQIRIWPDFVGTKTDFGDPRWVRDEGGSMIPLGQHDAPTRELAHGVPVHGMDVFQHSYLTSRLEGNPAGASRERRTPAEPQTFQRRSRGRTSSPVKGAGAFSPARDRRGSGRSSSQMPTAEAREPRHVLSQSPPSQQDARTLQQENSSILALLPPAAGPGLCSVGLQVPAIRPDPK